MEFKICQDIAECKKLWNEFSPNKRLFDVWDFRMCFYDSGDNEPYFIAGWDGKGVVGLIPLSFSKSKNRYEYFGGWFTAERNLFFLKDKVMLPIFLQQCPHNTLIEGIDSGEGKYFTLDEDEYTYYLDLEKYNNDFEEYLGSFDKKRQKNLKRDLKNLPEYKVCRNRLQDFDRLVELNTRQYEEDSKFNDKTIRSGIHKMASLADEKGILDMLSLEINGRVEAVDINILLGDCYYAIIGGSNNQKIPNLGKLMTILDIKRAIEKKAGCVDFFATSGHWKSMLNFDREMLLKFSK